MDGGESYIEGCPPSLLLTCISEYLKTLYISISYEFPQPLCNRTFCGVVCVVTLPF